MNYLLSKQASNEFFQIYDYTLRTYGEQQADGYLAALERCFERLAEHPSMGQTASEFGKELRRYPFKQHQIFYQPLDHRIFVVRILHQKMDAMTHFETH